MENTDLYVDPEICTCQESMPGTVTVFHNSIEHHCSPPAPCWADVIIFDADALAIHE